MKSLRLLLLILLTTVTIATNTRAQGFMRVYNLPAGPTGSGSIITATQTPDGGYICFVTDGQDQQWLMKTDPLGQPQWTKEVVDPGSDVQADLYVTPDGNYALGNYLDATNLTNRFHLFDPQGNELVKHEFQGFIRLVMRDDGFLISHRVTSTYYTLYRLDWQGNIVWEESRLTQYLGFLHDMTATQDGGACMMVSYDTLGGPYPKLIKLDAEGDVQWERVYPIQGLDFYGRILQNTAGGYVFTNQTVNSNGSILMAVDADGDSLWRKNTTILAFGLCQTNDGGYGITGVKTFTGTDLWKTDESGNTLFEKKFQINGTAQGVGWDVRATTDGGMVIGGGINYKAVLIKTDVYGNIHPNFIVGKVAYDQNHDCQPGAAEPALKNWTVIATDTQGQEYFAVTDETGRYEINVNVGEYTVEVHPLGSLWEPCDPSVSIDLNTPQDTATVHFPVQDSALCSMLDVSIGTFRLRRCFDEHYIVSWCNQGTAPAYNASVEVVLPPELDFLSTSHPFTQSGDTLWFDIGTVGFNDCGQLSFKVNVNCDETELGQTLCVEARIFPDTLCYETQNWSGARVVATARCLGDTTVEFRLRNLGPAPTAPSLDYIITEDLVVLMQGNYNLNPNQEHVITRAANGAMQRIEAEQEPGYPFASLLSAAVEGCGNPPLSLGLITQFENDDASPFTDIDCRQVVGSYDPNDKQGFPAGYGNQHFIEPGTDITYLIRFQNTGTDTAYTVTVRDTLSAWLDPATMRPGAASHPFTWQLTGSGALAFHFENILLPDSNVNEPASHGFVQFRISQRPGVPLGTVIENDAAIFFDYNAPIVTNTTRHVVGQDFVAVSVENGLDASLLPVRVSPNPFRERTVISLPDKWQGEAAFRLFDSAGRALHEVVFSENTFEFSAQNLLPGLYLFEIRDTGGQLLGRGKVVRN